MPETTQTSARESVLRVPAVILFGPTGAGKTPLGRLVESRGLQGMRWRHLDFGEELRRAAGGSDSPPLFTPQERTTLCRILQEHRLLRADELWIAERILKPFAAGAPKASSGVPGGVVLNGLPRNLRQTELVHRYFDTRLIVQLTADAETIQARLRSNRGGDRTDRTDDTPDAVARKLDWYHRETLPLIEHYRRSGCTVVQITVSKEITPEQTYRELASRLAAMPDLAGGAKETGESSGREPQG